MSKYIDIEKAIPLAIEAIVEVVGHGISQIDAVHIADKFEEAPAADVVEVKHAHWVVCGTFDDFLKCSLCESEKYPMAQVGNHQYCPECGAKMDGRRANNGTDT